MALLDLAALDQGPLPRTDVVRRAHRQERGLVAVELLEYPHGQVASDEGDRTVEVLRGVVEEVERLLRSHMGDPAREHDRRGLHLRDPRRHVDYPVLGDYGKVYEARIQGPLHEHRQLAGGRRDAVRHDQLQRLQVVDEAYVGEHPADDDRLAGMLRLEPRHGGGVQDVHLRVLDEYRVLRKGEDLVVRRMPEEALAGILVELHYRIVVAVLQHQRVGALVGGPGLHERRYGLAGERYVHLAHGDVLAVHGWRKGDAVYHRLSRLRNESTARCWPGRIVL